MLLHALPSFLLPDTKRNIGYAVVGVDLLKVVDNSRMVCSSVNVLIGGNLFFLVFYMLRYLATRRLRTAQYVSHSSRTPTGTKHGDFMTSPVYVHTRTNRIPWRLSACANSMYQALSPPPPLHLGMRLPHHQ